MILLRIVSGIVALGVMWAGVVLGRIMAGRHVNWIRRMRWLIVGLATYGSMTLINAAIAGVSVRDALHPGGLLHALPFVLQGVFIGGFVILPLGCVAAIIRAGIPRFREQAPRPLWFQAIALTACVTLLITSLELRLGEKHLDPQARLALLDNSLRAVEDAERESPRDRWDPDYVVQIVGRDPQKLFEWVRDNTFWIPYRGVLRGPVGVLMDGQGNSLDRALLLATLLEKAGQSVRLAHGELPREAALSMLPRLTAERAAAFWTPAKPTPLPEPDFRAVTLQRSLNNAVGQGVKSAEETVISMKAQLDARVSDQTRRLLQAIGPTKSEDEWTRRYETTMAVLRDYWWVQRQDGREWIDLDLCRDEGTPTPVQKETLATNEIPGNLHHEVAIRVVEEQSSSDVVSEHKVLEYVLRPSQVMGQPIVLQFMPTNWMDPTGAPGNGSDIRSALLNQHEWSVGLALGDKDVASAVLRDSEIGSSTETITGTGARAAGDPFGGLGAALNQALNSPHAPTGKDVLSAVWIEYDIRLPGEKPRIIRRTVFDLRGPAARASGLSQFQPDENQRLTRGLALTMKTEILPVICQLAPEFVAHLAVGSLTNNAELLHDIATNEISPNRDKLPPEIGKARPPVSPLMTLAFTRLQWSGSSGTIFIDRPNVLTRHESLFRTGTGIGLRNAFDIVANEVAVDLTSSNALAARLEQGVRDTNAEALMLANVTGNTAAAYSESHDWVSIPPAQKSLAAELSFSDNTRGELFKDLADGYVVVTPRGPVQRASERFVGWWRIDPATGDTLGVADGGWGQAVTEESSQLRTAIEFSRGFVFEYTLCQSFPLAVNSIKVINEEIFGGWHPSWTGTAGKSEDPLEMADRNMNMCVAQAIASGFLATLPIVLMTWKVSQPARGLAFVKRVIATEEEVEAARMARPCAMGPVPPRYPLAIIVVSSMAALFFQGPCGIPHGPRDTIPDTTEYGPHHTVVEPPDPATVRVPGVTHVPTDYEVAQAYEALKRAEMKLLPEVQELCRYMGQPVGRDGLVEVALRERAETTFFQEYSPAVDRYLTLRKLRDFFNGK